MKTLVILLVSVWAVNCLSLNEQWAGFKVKHSKVYKNIAEEKLRFGIFQETLKKIEEHNAKYEAGLSSYWMGVNQFSDLTTEEFSAFLRKSSAKKPKIEAELHVPSNVSIPTEIDWRKKGAVLGVKNQGACGSCWAFSATGALEGQNAIIHNQRIPLSEQQLLDCSGSYGNGDCDVGGEMTDAFDYVRDHGIESESSYPYEAEQYECTASEEKTVLSIKGYKNVTTTVEGLREAVATVGPISIGMYAEPIQSYEGGIFDGFCEGETDHGVLAVGYGESPKPYWIVKNSWGAYWGENGYFRISRKNNLCNIASEGLYPIVI
ncbi:unnamed protein product [Phyllotreta striolata]|uniref:Uncharacterized protein n=1 Tax=Phyllotreta striolata TaxID=444603 RepID=A0A9N9XMB6_PHYSR|nr:unnamed protein product [Phyllotreta striolata]